MSRSLLLGVALCGLAAAPSPGRANPQGDALYQSAVAKEAAADHAGAIKDAEAAAQADPALWQAWQVDGNARVALGDRNGAIACYRNALTVNPNNPQLKAYVDQLAGSAAPAATTPAAAASPGEASYQAALARYSAGDQDGAMTQAAAAVRADPNHWQAWQLLGNVRVGRNDKRGALEAYDRSLAIHPDNPDIRKYADSLRAEVNAAPPLEPAVSTRPTEPAVQQAAPTPEPREEATAVRRTGVGDVEYLVDGTGIGYGLYGMGNPAGLALEPRQNRVDLKLAYAGAGEKQTVGGGGTTRTDSDITLEVPGDRYDGVVWWITDKDVVALAPVVDSFSSSYVFEPAGSIEDQEYSGSHFGARVQYARAITSGLHGGVSIRPLFGSLTGPVTPGLTSDSTTYALFDFSVGAAFRLPHPVAGGELTIGVNYQPYNDTPNLLDLVGAAGLLATAGGGGVGGFSVKRTLESDQGLKQTIELEPSGSILGAQAVFNREDRLQAAVDLDITAASVDETTTTDATALGGAQKTETGTAQEFSRVRWGLGLRWLTPMIIDRAFRVGVGLRGAASTSDALDYPDSSSILSTTEETPLTFLLGISTSIREGITTGAGLEVTSTTRVNAGAASSGSGETVQASDVRVRSGAEYRLTPALSARLGIGYAVSRQESDDPSASPPGTDLTNPILADLAIALGGGYRGDRLGVDLALVLHLLAQTPIPAPPDEMSRSRIEFKIAGSSRF